MLQGARHWGSMMGCNAWKQDCSASHSYNMCSSSSRGRHICQQDLLPTGARWRHFPWNQSRQAATVATVAPPAAAGTLLCAQWVVVCSVCVWVGAGVQRPSAVCCGAHPSWSALQQVGNDTVPTWQHVIGDAAVLLEGCRVGHTKTVSEWYGEGCHGDLH